MQDEHDALVTLQDHMVLASLLVVPRTKRQSTLDADAFEYQTGSVSMHEYRYDNATQLLLKGAERGSTELWLNRREFLAVVSGIML